MLVLLDISKAFDTINSGVLLLIILAYIVSDASTLTLLKSCIANRWQTVLSVSTDSFRAYNGVPQVSILEPPIFTLYTLKICKASSLMQMTFYLSYFPADIAQENATSIKD